MASQLSRHRRLHTSDHLRPHSFVLASEIAASVTYAKICSDYLAGQAASVRDLKSKSGLSRQTSLKEQRYAPASELPPAHVSSALDYARRVLLRDFRRFESDSISWAGYLRSASDLLAAQPPSFVEEAEQIMEAVQQVASKVQKACGVECSPRLHLHDAKLG